MLNWAKAIHEAIGIESPKLFIVLFALVGFVLFGVVGWLVDHGYRVKSREQVVQPAALRENTPPSHSGTAEKLFLNQPTLREGYTEIELLLGGNVMRIDTEQLREPVSPFALFQISAPFIRLYLKDRTLCVDADFSVPGRIGSVQIACNSFTGAIPGWDHNSSDRAFEVVDENLNPALQLVFLSATRVAVRGSFTDGHEYVRITEGDMRVGPGLPAPLLPPLRALFRYPSWKYPGIYNEPSPQF